MKSERSEPAKLKPEKRKESLEEVALRTNNDYDIHDQSVVYGYNEAIDQYETYITHILTEVVTEEELEYVMLRILEHNRQASLQDYAKAIHNLLKEKFGVKE